MPATTLETENREYRSISPWAIGALLTALISPLAIANVLLLVIPLIALFLSLGALRVIQRNADITSGAGLAKMGLLLSLFVLIYVPSRIQFRNLHLQKHAIQLSDEVLKLAQRKAWYKLHHLSLRKFMNRNQGKSLAAYYAEEPPLLEKLQLFKDSEAPKKLAELDAFTFERETIESYLSDDRSDGFILRYKITPPPERRALPFRVWVVVERRWNDDAQAFQWWFHHMHADDPAKSK